MKSKPRGFGDLLRQIAAQHHEGEVYGIAKELGLSSGLIYQWRDGTVKAPRIEHLEALARRYGLDMREVLNTIPAYRTLLRYMVPTIAGGADTPLPHPVEDVVTESAHYVKFFPIGSGVILALLHAVVARPRLHRVLWPAALLILRLYVQVAQCCSNLRQPSSVVTAYAT